jgi:hypothetical protein
MTDESQKVWEDPSAKNEPWLLAAARRVVDAKNFKLGISVLNERIEELEAALGLRSRSINSRKP